MSWNIITVPQIKPTVESGVAVNTLLESGRAAEKSATALTRRSHRIKQAMREQMASTHRSALRHVACEYQHGILKLFGRVRSYYLKQLAQEYARRVDGVTHIINSIYVDDESNPIWKAVK